MSADQLRRKQVDNKAINVTVEPTPIKKFTPTISDLQDKAMNLSRMSEQGVINEKTGAAMVIREDGQTNMSSGKYTQYKLSPSGRATEISMESSTITNRKKFTLDDFVINEHKMNPQLWEYADFRVSKLTTNDHAIVGSLCMMGSVLTKAWDHDLKRYVLIRRPWMGPVFGPLQNVPGILDALKIKDDTALDEDILALSDKGYQVNGAVTDKKSLIGKDGDDGKFKINRSGDALSEGGGNSSNPGGGGNGPGHIQAPATVGPAPGKGVENIPSYAPQWTKDIAVRCSKKCGIPADWLWAQWNMESGSFKVSDGNYNLGGIKAEEGGWMHFNSPEEYADYFAWFVTQWNDPPTTGAKTMEEYVNCLQYPSDGRAYCQDENKDRYYSLLASSLGNTGTVIK